MVHASSVTRPSTGSLVGRQLPFDQIDRADWDRLLAATASATPFSRWTFHRAWWDAYGATAHEQYLACFGADDDSRQVQGIVPLMHRHEVEEQDAPTHTVLREHSPTCADLPGEARAIFFGASYHADYATVLAAASDLENVALATARALAGSADRLEDSQPWDLVDLRRLKQVDPALPALESGFRRVGANLGWRVNREQEDLCPVVTVRGDTWDEYLATLNKTARHEIRRKIRRAQAIGELTIEISPPTPQAIDEFIRLHVLRFGEEGLFPNSEGGRRSRHFIHRLAELELAEPDGGQMHVALMRCAGRLVLAVVAFDDGRTCYLYNGGADPGVTGVSPGVTGTAFYFMNRMAAGRRRFDFLRGSERYKYEWGAVDEPIFRLLVERGAP